MIKIQFKSILFVITVIMIYDQSYILYDLKYNEITI